MHWTEADDIVIAGMGGETIAAILRNGLSRWLPEGREALGRMAFLLQPMSRPEELRRMLLTGGFSLFEEKTVEEGGHLYTVMRAGYTGAPPCTDEASFYIGALSPKDGAAFLRKQRIRLARRARRPAADRRPLRKNGNGLKAYFVPLTAIWKRSEHHDHHTRSSGVFAAEGPV